MPWHMPTRKTEAAFAAMLASMLDESWMSSVEIYQRFSGIVIREPCLQIVFEEAGTNDEKYGPVSAQWTMEGKLTLRSHYAREKAPTDAETLTAGKQHDAWIGAVVDLLRTVYQDAGKGIHSSVPRLLNECNQDTDWEALSDSFLLLGTSERVAGNSYETEIRVRLKVVCAKLIE